jgi:hypothetical protein
LMLQAWPTAQGTCEVVFHNASSGSITPASGIYTIIAKRTTAQLL